MTVTNNSPEISRRIRALRQSRGLSLRALAQKAGVALSFLSKIENGKGSPTLATLMKLLEALDISVPEFFSGAARKSKRPLIIQRAADMKVLDDGERLWRYLFPGHLTARVVMTYEEYRPGTRNTEWERHPSDLCGFVLSGTLTLESAGNTSSTVNPGDSFYIRAGASHVAANRGKETLRLVVVELLNAGVVHSDKLKKSRTSDA